jgi:hypothetical protein
MVWRIGVLAAWAAAVGVLVVADGDAAYLWGGGVAVTVIVGALVNRGWALLTPLVVAVVYFLIQFVQDPSCSDCTEDTWGTIALLVAIAFALPAVLAMAAGLGLRRSTRFFRGLDSDPEPQAAPPR